MSRDRKLWSTLFLEVVSIVFGVLLALGANAWYQHSREQELVRSVLEDIRVELRQNVSALEEALPYHQLLADTLAAVFVADALDEFDLRGVWRGARVPGFQSAAYETAVITQSLALMRFETSSHLAAIYKQQSALEKLFERYLEAVLAIDFRDSERVSQLVWMMAGDVVLGEKLLRQRYQETLEFLK